MRSLDPADARLVAAFRAGDEAAFAALHRRYERRLLTYARRMLRDRSGHAEDVVQEAMLRAARTLRRDDRPVDLRPWLFTLVRNCALDELQRVRAAAVLDDELRGRPESEPEHAVERRARLREVLDDLAGLPAAQRHALVRREVDGATHTEIAAELGVGEGASRSLVARARAGLVKGADARSADCGEVRAGLLAAADARRRASTRAYRHVATCAGCRAFRAELHAGRGALALLQPGPLLLAGLTGGGLGALLAGKGAAAKATAGAAAGAAAVGVAALGTQVFVAGQPAPAGVASPVLPAGRVAAGAALPPGTAMVVGRAELAAGPAREREVRLACPPGLAVADLLPPGGTALSASYAPATVAGFSRVAVVRFERTALARPARVRVTVLCKRRDAQGSVLAAARTTGARRVATVRAPHAALRTAPGGRRVRSSLRRGQPVLVRGGRGAWAAVLSDAGERGWVPRAALGR